MAKGTIAVIGANQCGLAFAAFSAEAGFKVSVYEQKSRGEVPYNWTDEIPESVFSVLGIEKPPAVLMGDKPQTTLISPDGLHFITLPQSKKNPLIPVDREQLDNLLYERAVGAGAEFHYNCEAKSAIIKENTVCGVEFANGETVLCDLVVDCSGAESRIRSRLPDSFHIPQRVHPDDMFFTKRIFFERNMDVGDPEFSRKIYLKHRNEKGISWCWLSLCEKQMDVLIGRCGNLSNETYLNAVNALRRDNPNLGEEIIKGGELCKIPVRRGISRMIANGYALVGDSAYMTVPIMGSGMAAGMSAARILCEVIERPVGKRFSAENLYRYQYKYFKETGAVLACAEMLKNHFLNGESEEINFLMSSGDEINSMFKKITDGKYGSSAEDVLKCLLSFMKQPSVTAGLALLAGRIGLLYKTATEIPKYYDDEKLLSWQKKYDGYFLR